MPPVGKIMEAHVFIISTIYQGLVAAYLMNALESDVDVIVFDATEDGLFLKEPSCFENGVRVEIFFDSKEIQKSYILQLLNKDRIWADKTKYIKKIISVYTFNDTSPVEVLFAKNSKKMGAHINFVEEGLSAYREINKNSIEFWKGVFKMALAKLFLLECKINYGHSVYNDTLYLSNPSLFAKIFPKIETNFRELAVDKNNKNINQRFISRFAGKKINQIKYPAVLYIGQPLSEAGLVSYSDEISIIERVRKEFEKHGWNFNIKPHPRENPEKYGSLGVVLDSKIPVELLISTADPKNLVIISPFSSVNMNMKNIQFAGNIYIYSLFGINIDIDPDPIVVINNENELGSLVINLDKKCI